MNSRERALAILLIGVIVFGGGGLFGYQFVYSPWSARSKQLANLKKEANDKLARLDAINQKRPKLARYQMLSLPGEDEVAQREYEKYLTRLLDRHNIKTNRSVTPQKIDTSKTAPTTADKVPIYKRLSFTVQALATTDDIVHMLKDFYSTGLLQEIRTLTIKRQLTTSNPGGGQTKAEELDLNMTVEALIVTGAEKRPYLLPNFSEGLMAADLVATMFGGGTSSALWVWPSLSPGVLPMGLLADPERNYSAITQKNIFLGRPPPKERVIDSNEKVADWIGARYSHLVDIIPSTFHTSATIYDVSTNTKYRILESDVNNIFPFVRDGDSGDRLINGVVVKIDDREVTFRTEMNVPDGVIQKANVVRVSKKEREEMIEAGAPTEMAADGLLRVDRAYWDKMVRQKIIVKKGKGEEFAVEMTREREPVVANRRPSGTGDAAPPGRRGAGRGGFPGAGRGGFPGAGRGGAAPGGGEAAAPGDGGFDLGGMFGEGGGMGGFGPPTPFQLMRVKVVLDDENVDPEHLYVRPEEHYYTLHIGDSLEDSLKKPLSAQKVKELKDLAAK